MGKRSRPGRIGIAAALMPGILIGVVTIGTAQPGGAAGVTPVGISAGYYHSCARLSIGTVKCWGRNGNGQLGNGTTTNSPVPVTVKGLTGVTAISAGGLFTCARLSTGTVKCWGDNLDGSLGNGTTIRSPVPVTVKGLTGVVAISAGEIHACARLSTGTVKCWGDNPAGQLGDGSTNGPQMCGPEPCSTTPVSVKGLTGVTVISAGYEDTCARLSTGTVKCWGDNGTGQLGNGTYTGPQQCLRGSCSSTPVAVKGLTGVPAVAVGYDQTCARLNTGTVKCWGDNRFGELGNGTTTHSLAPVSVKGLTGATAIAVGTFHNCALLSTGTVKCWGDDGVGELGNGSSSGLQNCLIRGPCSTTPVAVKGLTGASAIAAGDQQTCALLSTATVECWGDNLYGELGNGTTTNSNVPVAVMGL